MAEGSDSFRLGTSPGYREALLDSVLSLEPNFGGGRPGWAAQKKNGGTRLDLDYETLGAEIRLQEPRFSIRLRAGKEWGEWESREVEPTEGRAYYLGDGRVLGPEARARIGDQAELENLGVWCLVEWGGRFP